MATYGAIESDGLEPSTPVTYTSLRSTIEKDGPPRRLPSKRAVATIALVAGVGVAAWSARVRMTAGATVSLHDINVPKTNDKVTGPTVNVS